MYDYEKYCEMKKNIDILEDTLKQNMMKNPSIKNIYNIFIAVKDTEKETYSLDVEYSDNEGYHRKRGVYSYKNLENMFINS